MGQTPVHLFDPINDFVASELNKRYRHEGVQQRSNSDIEIEHANSPPKSQYTYGLEPLTLTAKRKA